MRQASIAAYFGNIDGWKVVGTADLNGDGIRDILLQNSVSTYVGAWLMNTAGQAASFIPVYFDNIGSWRVVGTEDLDGDGITDIILQDAISTYVGAWLMNGFGQAVRFVPFYFDNIGGPEGQRQKLRASRSLTNPEILHSRKS